MSCPENNCIPCQSECAGEQCADKNYQDVNCDQYFPFKCATFTGSPIPCLGINTGDNGDVVIAKLVDAVCDNVIPGADTSFKISSVDTGSGVFEDKVLAGAGITFTKSAISGVEKITISSNGITSSPTLVVNSTDNTITSSLSGSGNHTADLGVRVSPFVGNLLTKRVDGLYIGDTFKVKVSNSDTTGGSLLDKLQAGSNITLTKVNSGGNETILISSAASAGLQEVTKQSSPTVTLTGTGAPLSALTAALKISTNVNNLLSVDSEGLLVLPQSDGKILTSSLDTVAGYLVSKILPGTDITITSTTVSGNERLTINSFQTPITVIDSSTVDLSVTGTNNHTITASVKVSALSGNLITVETDGLHVALPSLTIPPIVANDSSSIDFTVSGTNNHTITGIVKVSSTIGNSISIDGTGLYVPPLPSLEGTTNFISKFASPNSVVSSLLYDDGSKVVIGGTSGSSLFNVIGQAGITNTTVHTTGTAAALGISANTTFSGSLPTTNASFSAQVIALNSTFNGATTIAGDTPFSTIIAVSKVNFSSTGTVTVNPSGSGLKAISSLTTSTFDDGTVNGTITKSAGIQINGIFKVAGSTATITRTDHYQLLINDTDEFADAGSVTNKWGIYQIGSNDTNFFGGRVILNNLPVFADNTAAASLPTGTVYRTATGDLKVKY